MQFYLNRVVPGFHCPVYHDAISDSLLASKRLRFTNPRIQLPLGESLNNKIKIKTKGLANLVFKSSLVIRHCHAIKH